MEVRDQTRERLARNIGVLMEAHKMKPEALAKRAGIGFRSLYRVLRCEQTASAELLEKIAQALNLEAWVLLVYPGADTLAEAHALSRLVRAFQELSAENKELASNMVSALSGDNTLAAPYPKDKARNTAA